jgi:hypothetical protein
VAITPVADERRIWDLLTRDFYWDIPVDFPVTVYGGGTRSGPTKLQIFEVAVAAIMARIHPDYEWKVTRSGRDSGLDFIGHQTFLQDNTLDIAAAITVGGQCKKRTEVKDILDVVGTSLTRMADTVNPTFFVVALSARVTRERVAEARRMLEKIHHRHCHILDRTQVEGLMGDHMDAVHQILREGLAEHELREVLQYFADRAVTGRPVTVEVSSPTRVLAGVPFAVDVSVRSTLVSSPGARLWWVGSHRDGTAEPVTLVGPVNADGPAGAALGAVGGTDDPLFVRRRLELVTYAVGHVSLGEILVGLDDGGMATPLERIDLGRVQVIENVRPRFFERPFRIGLVRLSQAYERALAGGVASVGVVGAGGSGKSRMCEEFALEKRRRGGGVVSAKQTKTHDDPHRVLADLLFSLAEVGLKVGDDPADVVIGAVTRYDRALAVRVGPAVRSLFGSSDLTDRGMKEQDLLSALLVLITVRARRAPLVIHLQDLHWCTTDVLKVLERLIWQLEQVLSSPRARGSGGVLVIFEGRIRESQGTGSDQWTSAPFEAFLDRVGGASVTCSSFSAEDGLDFLRLLFEGRHSANRLVSEELLELQQDLVRRIDRTAGGNPFHSLEQVQLLMERRIVGQNPHTGLLYAIRPEPEAAELPETVFASIELRWQYLRERRPDLALLVWACSLLEDRLPEPLFRRLRSQLAPDVSVREVDATDLLWTGDGTYQEVVFRHENYFNALRRFDVSSQDRSRAVEAYADWFRGFRTLSPAERFRWARVLLEAPEPDIARIRSLLRTARRGAQRQGDLALTRRIAATLLDLAWSDNYRSPLVLGQFLALCDDDLRLIAELLDSDRPQAERRLGAMRERLRTRLESDRHRASKSFTGLQRRRLESEVIYSQFLFNDQHPDRAAEIAEEAARDISRFRSGAVNDKEAWDVLQMEALHTLAVAVAIAGEARPALSISARAVEIARKYPSGRAHQIIGTHGNILLAIDPAAGVAILRECLADVPDHLDSGEADRVEIHLSIGLAILAHSFGPTDPARATELLTEARERLTRVVGACFRLGLYPDAGAAALMLGIVSALEDGEDAVSWFAQAVAASARGRQLETLWKAHFNLASALYRQEAGITQSVRDHALAALEIMEESLSSYSHPDQSPRFGLLRIPLVHAVRFLVLANDDAGFSALERHPALRACFLEPVAGVLRNDLDQGSSDHEWTLRVGSTDFVLY